MRLKLGIFASSGAAAAFFEGIVNWLIGANNGKLWASQDGTEFQQIETTPFGSSNVNDVAYLNNEFFAAGNAGKLFKSSDGLSWSTINTGDTTDINVINYGGDGPVPAGQTWTQVSDSFSQLGLSFDSPSGDSKNVSSLSYQNGLWFAGSGYGLHGISTNGINWTTNTGSFLSTRNTGRMLFHNNKYFRNSFDDINLFSRTQYSTDLINWVNAIGIEDGQPTLFSGMGSYSSTNFAKIGILYGANKYVQNGGRLVMWSDDGANWNTAFSVPPVFPAGRKGFDLAYGQGVFVWVGDSGHLLRSTNAISWTTHSSNFGNSWINTVSYGNNLWAIGGRSGQLRTSTNGITWVTRTANVANVDIVSITYGNNLWFLGGGYGPGLMSTSTDAITWTTVNNAGFSDRSLNDIAYGQGKWVAGGQNYRVNASVPINNDFRSYFIGVE